MDEEGYMTIVNGKKDMIYTGGENVSSREIEETIYQMDGVSEVSVIGIPDAYWFEAVMAVVVPKEGTYLTEEAVMSFCRERLSRFKVPKHVDFINTLPKNPSGKVLKRSLRDMYK